VPNALIFALEPLNERLYGGSLRTRAAADALRELGYEVSIVAPTARAPVGERLQHGVVGRVKRHFLPMPTRFGARSVELKRLTESAGQLDVAMCQAFQQAAHLFATPAAIRWLDFGDLQSEFCRKEATHRVGVARISARAQARSLARLETRMASRADIVTCAGYGDTSILRRRGMVAEWLPTPITATPLPRRPADGTIRVGFIGNFNYWPNVEAYERLRRHWMPTWGTGVEARVAGHGSTELPPARGVRLLGPVDDLLGFYADVDIVAAPVERGGGIKVKVAEALSFNRPVVASPEALEGFPQSVSTLCLVVKDAIPSVAELRALARRELPRSGLMPFTHSANLAQMRRLLDGATGRS
jgi:hypothetical protein